MRLLKRGKQVLLIIALMLGLFPVYQRAEITVQAETDFGYYPMQCDSGQYEVDTVNDDGSYSKISCSADINVAKNTMYANGSNAVVRHSASHSQSHVIMMSYGIVYSYPQRDNSNTVTIQQFYQDSSASSKTTYVTVHREMTFDGTYDYNPLTGDGTVAVTINGFSGFISLKNIDLVPMKYVTNHIAIWLGGNQTSNFYENPFLTYVYQGYYKVEQNGSYLDLVYHCHSGWADPKDSSHEPAEWTFDIGPAADWMTSGAVYYSKDGVNFYSDRYYGSQAGVYYDYYQFLPLRTTSSISASTFNTFLSSKGKDSSSKLWDTGQTFLDAQSQYGINALLVYAMACLESGYGTSDYAKNRNNLFGWSAYDSNPDSASYFSSISQAVNEHMGINLRGYINTNDTRFFGPQLGNKGSGLNVKYAGDPYWGMKIAAIAYEIDKCNNGWSGQLTDYNASAVGVITDDTFTDVLSSAGGSTLYNTQYGSRYQKNHMVSIIAESGDWYEIQSTNYISNGSILSISSSTGLLQYDWNTNVGWVKKSSVTRTNSAILDTKGTEPTGDVVRTLGSISFTADGGLSISGQNYRPGIYVTADNSVVQTAYLMDGSFKNVGEVKLTSVLSGSDVLGYTGVFDLSSLENGTYFFSISTVYGSMTDYNDLWQLSTEAALPEDLLKNGKVYHLSAEGDTKILKLTVSDISCGTGASYDSASNACVCMTGYENWLSGTGCSVKAADTSSLTLMRSTDQAFYKDDGHTIVVSGVAFIQGMNAAASQSDIKETVSIVNMETQTETPVNTVTSSLATAYNLYDGYDYTQIQYSAEIDLAELEPGSYYLKISLQNGDVTKSGMLVMNRGSETLDTKSYTRTDGYTAVFKAVALTNYRLEISIEKSQLDTSVISKPNRSASVFGANTITLNQSVLSIDGYAFMNGASASETDNPKENVILVSEEDGRVITLTPSAESKACAFDITSIRGSKYDLSNSCFSFSSDLSSLSAGTYLMYIDLSSGSYRDIYNMYSISSISLPSSEVNGRTYVISKSSVRSRFVLTITDPAVQDAESSAPAVK